MQVRIWGCRGSLPSPGPKTVRFGGNTACVAVTFATPPAPNPGRVLALDAGTGIRGLGHALARTHEEIYVLTSHAHWDHIQGFPFFDPVHQPGRRVTLLTAQGHRDADALMGQFDGTSFPLRPEDLAARVIRPEVGAADVLRPLGLHLSTVAANHPGGCLGYRLAPREGGPALVYLTDNELRPPATAPHGGPHATPYAAFVAFARGAEVLIHDAAYTDAELARKAGWGHSSVEQAVALALDAGVKKLLLFHHDPDRDDEGVEALERSARGLAQAGGGALHVSAAREGDEFAVA